MTGEPPQRLLLGPQRPVINLAPAVARIEPALSSLAVISAAWQEAENDIDHVRRAVGLPLTDLELYSRAERVFAAEPALAQAYRARQDRLRELQQLYRLRLRQLALAARLTLRADADPAMVAAEQRHAVAQLRALDRHHLGRTEEFHRDFETLYGTSPAVTRHAAEIAELIDRHDGILITGGNIIVLLNRMRLFGLANLMDAKPIVAWSAGAMVLADRIVLFHERMPQGRRDPEVLGRGLGLVGGTVFLPDPSGRLRQKDPTRMSLMGRRFSPDSCITLDSGSCVEYRGGRVQYAYAARRIGRAGQLKRLRAA
jgi:Peptidase family S51